MLTRREFTRGIGVAAVAPTMASVVRGDHFDHQPDHVTLTYDESKLLNYAPRLEMAQEAEEKFMGLWGMTATSQEYDDDIHVYAALYTHQDGLSPFGRVLSDSHHGDTEWYYVASNPDTGEVTQTISDAYHWLAGKLSASAMTMDGTHPVSRVVSPWHFYSHADVTAENATSIDEVADLTSRFQTLLNNGLEDDVQPGTVVNPTLMDIGGRTHWWKDSFRNWSRDAALARTAYKLGFAGAEDVRSPAGI